MQSTRPASGNFRWRNLQSLRKKKPSDSYITSPVSAPQPSFKRQSKSFGGRRRRGGGEGGGRKRYVLLTRPGYAVALPFSTCLIYGEGEAGSIEEDSANRNHRTEKRKSPPCENVPCIISENNKCRKKGTVPKACMESSCSTCYQFSRPACQKWCSSFTDQSPLPHTSEKTSILSTMTE